MVARLLSVVLLALYVFGHLGHYHHHQDDSQKDTSPVALCMVCALSTSAVTLPGKPVLTAPSVTSFLTPYDPVTELRVISRPVTQASSRAPPSLS